MKVRITKAEGHYAEEDAVGEVHLLGPIDSTACGLALEDYQYKSTNRAVSCTTCIDFLQWAKDVAKQVKK